MEGEKGPLIRGGGKGNLFYLSLWPERVVGGNGNSGVCSINHPKQAAMPYFAAAMCACVRAEEREKDKETELRRGLFYNQPLTSSLRPRGFPYFSEKKNASIAAAAAAEYRIAAAAACQCSY